MYQHITVPTGGQKISVNADLSLAVPDQPIIPFIEGDGTGADIWRASVRVLDASVAKAYDGKRQIRWMEVYAGQKSFDNFGSWLPDETVKAFQDYLVGIKGPLTTPIGGGIEHELGCRPDIDAGAVALDEGDDGLIGNVERPVGRHGDLLGHGPEPTGQRGPVDRPRLA